MKDRYLFKAKRVDNGEWGEGYLMDENYINTPFNDESVGGRFDEPLEIDTNTICQCTGLKDTNDNLIYENDIIKCCRLDEYGDEERYREHIESVDWDDYGFYVNDGNTGSDSLCLYDNSIDYIDTIATVEVIGNKFDNPELLEVEK